MDEDTENKEIENQDEISKLVGDKETINTIFNEPVNLLNDLMDTFSNKSYATTLRNGRRVLDILNEPTQQYIKVGIAFSISAATEWVTTLGEVGVDISRAEELISEAREKFSQSDFSSADETIGKVLDMIPDLESEQKEAALEGISSTERLIEEVKNVGAGVENAERDLQQAKNFFDVGNYPEVSRLTKEAKDSAEEARQRRIQTVSDALLFTKSVIDESKDVGVNIKESEDIYNEAKAAFADGEFQKCSELVKEAEERALQLQDEHIQKVMELKERRASMAATREEAAKPEEKTEEKTKEENCPSCGAPMRYVEKYDRCWCKSCRKYAPRK
ncbi:MAG: hypothetical protein JSV09_06715 [Thermoplasmata archaeon]|nr:MAG: hypothetical protein JSV09_06715 [Thermoplasmata archaeon]